MVDPVQLSQNLVDAAHRGIRASSFEEMAEIDPSALEGDHARIAFWTNLYNALLLNRLHNNPVRGPMPRHVRLFSTTSIQLGSRGFTMNEIEHGVLRRNSRGPYRLRKPFGKRDPRLSSMVERLDPRIHFALNCGARSCPPIRAYDAAGLDDSFQRATAAYMRAEATVDFERGAVVLPNLMKLYKRDFGPQAEQLDFAESHLPKLAELRKQGGQPKISYAGFDWRAAHPG